MVLVFVGMAAVALAGTAAHRKLPAPPPPASATERPTLLLLTSLPLLFSEDFTLGGGGSPMLDALVRHYTVRSISIADAPSLAGRRLLLMAHSRAQTAEALVDLDAWVRRGGRLLLLADPALDWPSRRPLGDRLRPPPGFADTGLLTHWGLALEPPAVRGPVVEEVDGRTLTFPSPGTLRGSSCPLLAHGRIARCSIGQGKATIVADADLLNDELSGEGAAANREAIIAELDRLAR